MSDEHLSFRDWLETLSDTDKGALVKSLDGYPLAAPQEGPQEAVFSCPADVVGYGGAAGGGKSALAALLAIHEHERSVVFRRESKQLSSWIDDLVQFSGTDKGLNRQSGRFTYDSPSGRKIIEWGGLKEPTDWVTWRGRPHDLIVVEEATEVPFAQYKKVIAWNRSTKPGQRCRILLTFNPPGAPDEEAGEGSDAVISGGRWIIDYLAPWLDERHPDPAQPGELRYFYRDSKGIEREKKNPIPEPVTFVGRDGTEQTMFQKPQSRTFIPALIDDNKYLRDTSYKHHLMSLEEPFRSQMLMGDFRSGIVDEPYQVLSGKWVDEAMERWEDRRLIEMQKPMCAIGIDVSRGGSNETVFARRREFFWEELVRMSGEESDSGAKVAARATEIRRDGADLCVDVVGVGSSAYDFLDASNQNPHAVISQKQEGIPQPDPVLKCMNLRASLWWTMRRLLNPENGYEPCLPKDKRLRSELVAPKYRYEGGKIKIEAKDDVIRRLGFSTDRADAVIYSLLNLEDAGYASRIFGWDWWKDSHEENRWQGRSRGGWMAG